MERQQLLQLLLAEEGLAVTDNDAIVAQVPGGTPVLSYAQQRLWFLQHFETETAALSIRTAHRLRGHLDMLALRSSLDAIVARHDSLRMLITSVAGEPVPVVSDNALAPLHVDDLRSITDRAAQQRRLDQIMALEANRTFDLAHDLPLFIRVVHLGHDEHVLSVVMHHVAADGWSFQLFFRELSALYEAALEARTAVLPELPVRYQDYAAWQRNDARAETLDRQLAYWMEQLGGDLPHFEIAPDFRRPARHNFDGAQVQFVLPSQLSTGLRSLSQRSGATMFMTMLAAFQVVAARRAGTDDVIIGTPVAGRVRPELESMIGMFLNTLVLRTDLGGDPSFEELLRRVRHVSVDAFDHQDVPFERLLTELHPARDLSRSPLFQVFFNMMNFTDGAVVGSLSGLTAEPLDQPDLGSKFDLTLYVDDQNADVTLLLVYNRGLYRADTMEALLNQYVGVLAAVVADPKRPISQYSLVTPQARAVLPDPQQPLDAAWHGSVPAAVRRQACCVPLQVAVEDANTEWSYAVLASVMTRLGRWLRLRGLVQGDIVAIYGHRSASLVAAVTGVLASGAAYVLLDPSYPPSRLAAYLRVARPKAWLAMADAGEVPHEVVQQLDALDVCTRLVIPSLDAIDSVVELRSHPNGADEAIQGDVSALSGDDDDDGIGPDDLACLTFTSGSTGTPKAVMGRHGSLTHFLKWQSAAFSVTDQDRFSMLSGLAHDPIQRDIFWPLWVGATVVVPDPQLMPSAGYLARWMRDQRISVAHLTPAMGQLLCEASPSGPPVKSVESLRLALFIGDVLTRRDVSRLQQLAPAVQVVNLYGTTETQRASGYHVVDTTQWAADPDGAQLPEVLPLGTGMPGVQLLVQGPTGRGAGVGEVGEISMRSHHLAAGYLELPLDTSERFSLNAATGDPGDRIYRTGDRGRYRSDGTVEFLGRADQQVQLRGFRIELGEVQAALGRHSLVREAVVEVRLDAQQQERLVAFVVPEPAGVLGSAALDTADLAAFLRSQLPIHMVPTAFVAIDRIPLTPNAKVDRRALSTTFDVADSWGDEGPNNPLERMLVDMWSEVLALDTVGIHDNFFDLGGYSLLATRVFALIEKRTGKRVPVSQLFETPTIAELAAVITNDAAHSTWSSLVSIQPAGTKTPFFYVAPYLISVLQFAKLGKELGDDQPLYGLQPQGLDGKRPPHERIEDMAAHYIEELKCVQPQGPYLLGGHCSGAWVAFEMARQLEASGETLSAVVMVDQGPPGVERPPINPFRYLANRWQFYMSDGRLRDAVAWQLKLGVARLVVRRVGSPTARFVEEVRATHRRAFTRYQGATIRHPIVLLRSAESLSLADKVWYLRWADKTEGAFRTEGVPGTHANLLEQPYVGELATKLRWAFEVGDQPNR